jgi:hypothetical protein
LFAKSTTWFLRSPYCPPTLITLEQRSKANHTELRWFSENRLHRQMNHDAISEARWNHHCRQPNVSLIAIKNIIRVFWPLDNTSTTSYEPAHVQPHFPQHKSRIWRSTHFSIMCSHAFIHIENTLRGTLLIANLILTVTGTNFHCHRH